MIKGHTITWSMTVSVESNLEILTTNRTTHRNEMADWLMEMTVKEATQREELPKQFEKLRLTNEDGDDVIMLDYDEEQPGRVQQGEDDTTMSWEEALGTRDQVQKQRKRCRRPPRMTQARVREVKCSESEYYTIHGQYKARPVAHR